MFINVLQNRKKSCREGFWFCFPWVHWLKNWCEILKPITKHSSHNRVATLESHLKTALILSMDDIIFVSSLIC